MRSVLVSEARLLRWRWLKNGPATLGYLVRRPSLASSSREIVRELQSSGISVRDAAGDAAVFAEVLTDATRRLHDAWDGIRPRAEACDWKQDRALLGHDEAKDFLLRLIPSELNIESAYIRYALQPEFLQIADRYLGMECRVRAIHLWLNFPTRGEARSTQLWHRDYDDLLNLKVFTYLTDVDEEGGPFCFARETHPRGRLQAHEPDRNDKGRVTDESMAKVVPRSTWLTCLGGAGTTVFADTCGYHRGLKPIARPRLMLMCHYTSPAAYSRTDLRVTGSLPGWLTPRQRSALTDCYA